MYLVIQIMAVIVIGQENIKSRRRRKRGTQIDRWLLFIAVSDLLTALMWYFTIYTSCC